jgi:thymidylate synthase
MAHTGEHSYLALMTRVLEQGERREGRNGATRSLFGERLEFDLKAGFPLLTTKRVFWRGVVEELLWFLRGSTDAKELSAKGIHIWDGNTSREFLDSVGLIDVPEGSIGQGYGFQWRCFGGSFPERAGGFDQIRYLLEELGARPASRRAVLSAWNPLQMHRMALPPCHFTYVFYCSERDGLSCQMQMRSCDVGAGLPFNIASTALLTTLLATLLHVPAHRVVIVTGDTHLYEVHLESALEQTKRTPFSCPALTIRKEPPPREAAVEEKLAWLEGLSFEDFCLEGYVCHPPLKYAMVV